MKKVISARYISTTYLKILIVILVVEALIMASFSLFPHNLDSWQQVFVDVLLLALISTPLVYVFGIHPYIKQTQIAYKAEEDARDTLVRLNKTLEFQKKTLDEHALVSIADPEGNIFYTNEKFRELTGYTEAELFGRNHNILSSGSHPKAFFTNLWKTISKGKVWHGEIKNRAKNGSEYVVQTTIVPFVSDDGTPFQFVAVYTDITIQKKMEDVLNQAQNLAHIGSWTLEMPSKHLIWSEQIYNIFGLDPETFNASLEEFFNAVHPDDLEFVKDRYTRSLNGEFPYDIEHRIIRQDTGEIRWVHEKCIHQFNSEGQVIRSDGTVQDITERKQVQDELQHLAMTDPLTGLANRNEFFIHFDNLLEIAKREQKPLALLLLDLDKFKPVNDTFGHQVGDQVLKNAAKIFQKSCRETDIAARLGGDEFAILLFNPENLNAIEQVVKTIIRETNKPMKIQDHEIAIGISIGISRFPLDGDSHERLIENADEALYKVKKDGRNNFLVYQLN